MTDLHNLWLNGNMYTMKGGPVVQFVLALFTSFVFKRYFRSQVFVKADFKLTLQQHRCLAVMPSFIQQNYPPAAISIILLFILNSASRSLLSSLSSSSAQVYSLTRMTSEKSADVFLLIDSHHFLWLPCDPLPSTTSLFTPHPQKGSVQYTFAHNIHCNFDNLSVWHCRSAIWSTFCLVSNLVYYLSPLFYRCLQNISFRPFSSLNLGNAKIGRSLR